MNGKRARELRQKAKELCNINGLPKEAVRPTYRTMKKLYTRHEELLTEWNKQYEGLNR